MLLAFLYGCISIDAIDRVADDPDAPTQQMPADLAVQPESLLVEIDPLITQEFKPRRRKKRALTNYVDDIWLGGDADLLTRGQTNLPRRLTRFHDVVFITPGMRLSEIADQLSEIIGMPVHVLAVNLRDIELVGRNRVRYKGPIKGLLDVLATSFDASWSYDSSKRRIIFRRVLTRQLDFYAAAGEDSFTRKISNDRNFTTLSEVKLDPWREVKQALRLIMPKGSQISLSPMTGKITLTTTPSAMLEAMRLVRKRNRGLERQIYFNVQLLELNIPRRKEGRAAVSLAALLREAAAGRLKVNGKTAAAKPAPNQTPNQDQAKQTKKEKPKPKRAKSSVELVVSALSQIGELSVLASTNGWTRNGKSLPVRSTSEHAYMARAKTADNVSDFTPATVETGFYMNLRPLILPRDRVRLNFSASLKSLDQLRSFGNDANRVQLPRTSTKSWTQEAIIPSGATLLLSGFEVRQSASGAHVMMILLITPNIL